MLSHPATFPGQLRKWQARGGIHSNMLAKVEANYLPLARRGADWVSRTPKVTCHRAEPPSNVPRTAKEVAGEGWQAQ